MATVLLDQLLEGTFLGDVSLFVAVVAEAIVASASKKRTLYQASTTWGQGHPVFGCHTHRSVGDMCISDLLQCLYLFHPSLYSVYLHVNCEQSARQQLFLVSYVAKLFLDLLYLDQSIPQVGDFSGKMGLIKT